jgi:tRNA nucleotidyltransferase (CCA-adding enzyme)
MKQDLERIAKKIIKQLLDHGFEAYMVGGCVRDKQLSRPVKDYDIATSAKPEQVQGIFHRTIPTGLQHGTVSVIMDGCLFEVTTFRTESGYEDYRHPSEVQFIDSLYEDLRRRDFTMNAMALDIEGRLMDPFDGVSDIENGLLRCVGDAAERFQEDALRMLRCIRFAAQYGLRIEELTWSALLLQAPLLKHIAMERVRMELERMISEADPARAVLLLMESRLLKHVKLPLKLALIKPESLAASWDKLDEPLIKWAYLYLRLQADKAETEQELKQLTFSKQQVEQVREIVASAYEVSSRLPEEAEEAAMIEAWKLTAVTHGKQALMALHQILSVDPKALKELGVGEQESTSLVNDGLKWLSEMPVCSLSELALGGKELLALMNKPAGPWVSKVLAHLLREAALSRLSNELEALRAEAECYYESIAR